MDEKEIQLLCDVKMKCVEKPEFLSHFINVGVAALMEREREMRQMASDMETMASAMCFLAGQSRVSPKLKQEMSDLAISKLEKYHPKTFLNWSSNIINNSSK